MKKLLIFLFSVISIAAFGQAGSLSQSVYRSRVNDSTSVTTPAGYGLLYYNNQRATPAWLFSNDQGATWSELGSGTGGVTSVAITVPSFLSVSGSPITSSGTFAVTLATQSANTIFSGPTSGSAAAPTFRVIVTEDISGALTANRTVTSANATIQADNLNIVYLNSATPFNFTIDQLTDDSQVILINKNTATVTLVDGTGVTSSGSTVVEAGEMAVIVYDTPTAPIVFGGSAALTTVAIGDVTGLGTGVATALAVNVGSAGAVVINGGDLGTPSAGVGTNLTGIPYSALTGTAPYWSLASGGARTAANTLSGNFPVSFTGTYTGASEATPTHAFNVNMGVTQVGAATNKVSSIVNAEGLLTGSGGGVSQRMFAFRAAPTQTSAAGYFGWFLGIDPVSGGDAIRFGKPQASPTSTANNFEFLGGTSGATSLTLQIASGSITSTASSAANLVYRGGTGTSNLLDFGYGTTSVAAIRPAADISNGRGFSIRQDGANATGTASQRSSFAEIFEGSFWTGAIEQTRRSYIVQEASTATDGLAWLRTYAGLNFGYATVIQSMNLTNGNVGYGVATPSAMVHLPASTTAANTASLKINEGSRQTSAEDGTINYVANNLEFVETSTVHILAKTLTGTGTLNFGSIASLANEILTITVTGAADGDVVSIGVPNGSMTAGLVFTYWVSASNTVSVQCYNSTVGAIDPASGTFRASVIKY